MYKEEDNRKDYRGKFLAKVSLENTNISPEIEKDIYSTVNNSTTIIRALISNGLEYRRNVLIIKEFSNEILYGYSFEGKEYGNDVIFIPKNKVAIHQALSMLTPTKLNNKRFKRIIHYESMSKEIISNIQAYSKLSTLFSITGNCSKAYPLFKADLFSENTKRKEIIKNHAINFSEDLEKDNFTTVDEYLNLFANKRRKNKSHISIIIHDKDFASDTFFTEILGAKKINTKKYNNLLFTEIHNYLNPKIYDSIPKDVFYNNHKNP